MNLPFKRVLVIDFETAWDRREYTLSKMTTEEYVRDPRFKAWGLCWKEVGEDAYPLQGLGVVLERGRRRRLSHVGSRRGHRRVG